MSPSPTHWSQITQDPNARHVRQHLQQTLLSLRQGRIQDTHEFLRGFVRGKRTLDIGVVAHSIERTRDPKWKHNIVKQSAASVVGVDIIEEAVQALIERGYDVRLMDATSDEDLGQRFERVVIGDVIEHVDNPVALLRFAGRHLEPGGQILCSTPNPFFLVNIAHSVRDGVFLANAEHVAWITPTMALELAHRAGLRLHSYWHTQGEGKTPLRKLAVKALELAGQRDSELFSGSFYYIFEPLPDQP